MNRIDRLFEKKKEAVLSIYITAGYPQIDSLNIILPALEKAGVDLVEIGMPFSDPLADGPVIQEASQAALNNGMNLELLFKQLEKVEVQMPLILMGYLNPVLQFGLGRFLKRAKECGISGTIIPDLPVREYLKHQDKFEKNGIHNILLVTPQSSDERIKYLASVSKGFLYLVSSASTTGTKGFAHADPSYFHRIRKLHTGLPGMIGFGIKTRDDFQKAGELADGAIIGTEFIRCIKAEVIEKRDSLEKVIGKFAGQYKTGNTA